MSRRQNALGFDADTKVEKHESTVSFSKGYGGKFGVQKTNDKVKKEIISFFFSHYQSALGFDADTKVEKHESTVSFSKGYGGKFGVQQTNDKVCICMSSYSN